MKLSKETEVEIRQIYQTYWDAYLSGDFETFSSFLDDDIVIYGTALGEIFYTKEEALNFYIATAEQMTGKADFRNRNISIQAVGNTVAIYDQSQLYILIEGTWTFYGSVRITGILEQKNNTWKLVHQHGSFPDSRTEEGQQIASEKIKEENLQLREAVKRRTIELENKNHELKIETSLERVRAVAMSMQKPDDMLEVCRVISEQLELLTVKNIRNVQTAIIDESGKGLYLNYQYFTQYGKGIIEEVVIAKHPTVVDMIQRMQQSSDAFFTHSFEGKELEDWKQYRKDENQLPDPILEDSAAVHFYFYSIGNGGLGLSAYSSLTDEALSVFHKFRNAFSLAYQRFRDIEQAEVQAREAQIELALERVRAKTMAMQKSEELKEVIQVVFDQFIQLNIQIEHSGFILDYKTRDDMHIWLADSREVPSEVTIPYFDTAHWNSFNEAKTKGLDFFTNYLPFEEKNKFYQTLFEIIPGVPEETKAYYQHCPGLAISTVLLENVGLYIENFSGTPYTDEENKTLMRFGKVFQQTYTRFLDLQKAEAQARESQIELGLERVRARAMAMQKSDELADAAQLLYHEFGKLGISTFSCGYMFVDESKQTQTAWVVLPDGALLPNFIAFPLTGDEVLNSRYKDWKEKKPLHVFGIQGEANKVHHRFLSNYVPPFVIENIFSKVPDRIIFNCANFSYGYLLILSTEHFSSEEQQTIIRFAKAFEQTYTRFLDLQKAEANARESKIEAALERVRSNAMAMHSSKDLAGTIGVFYRELKILSQTPIRCGIAIINKETRNAQVTTMNTTEKGDSIEILGNIKMAGHKVLDEIFQNWLVQKEYHAILRGNEIKEYYQVMRPQISYPDYPNDNVQYGYYFMFTEGDIYAWTENELGEEDLQLYRRFANVISLTYKRYKDLIQAEDAAREAQIETGLERVRSRTMAMQSCDELAETASVVLYELVRLGIAPSRLFIAIIENDNTDVHFYLTSEDGGKDCSVYTAQIEKNISIRKMYNGWAEHHSSLTLTMEGDEVETYFNYLRDDVGVPFKSTQNPTRRVQTIAYFSQGYIGIASPDDQPEETTKLLERFAAVFNLTYTRFNDLKQAEKLAFQANLDLIRLKEEKVKTELALTELKAAQAQLIQAEKMASLGELTAGIAHEIQNPLNFVNNFSEVNTELIEEMREELQLGNKDEAIAIANDIAENEQKINHHGKRADAIVKGMLQHSRTSSGVKEPTDINALADEYLRLAYHGLRAKDKTFNANMKTDFDQSIGKVEIIPQDIGRVILNLITNAFYAVSTPKSPKGDLPYEPTVTIKTKSIKSPLGGLGAGKVEISVSDNGPGIPHSTLDKIFQPFFTTKPTGQGTGLGLSLSYDIIKAHGGEIKIETMENEGTTFIIQIPIT